MPFKCMPITVEPLVFLCMQALSLNFVAFPQILLEHLCLKKHNETKCAAMLTGSFKEDYDILQEESSLWFCGCLVFATFITVLTLPFVTTLSEEFGRKKLMFLTPVSQMIENILIVVILQSGLRFTTWLLMLVSIFSCFVGDVSALYVFACSYISDITTEETRTLRINFLEAATYLSGFTANLSSGFIIERIGYLGGFILNIGFCIMAILHLALFVKPIASPTETCEGLNSVVNETRKQSREMNGEKTSNDQMEARNEEISDTRDSKEERITIADGIRADVKDEKRKKSKEELLKKDDMKRDLVQEGSSCNQVITSSEPKPSLLKRLLSVAQRSNPITTVKRVYNILKASDKRNYGLILFFLIIFTTITSSGERSVIILYLKNHPYYFSPKKIGYFLSFQSALLSFLGMVCFNFLYTRLLKLNDFTILFLTTSISAVYCVLIGFANSPLMLYLSQLALALGSLATPTIRAMISKITPPSTVGILFAALLILETFAILIGSMISPLVYYAVASIHPGAVFFVNGFFMFVSVCVALGLFFANNVRKSGSSGVEVEVPDVATKLMDES
ncbi:uncharacterized protein LOC135682009 [Rhopilema esculentum]|uniref:uncharacterized protein LOC135682009 n=1 Tax=Rhopilema esculentum TaxID=499914 RepID=UPI0031DED0EF|eukprot:gene14101-5089_t